jgi:hypothetical protein
MKINQYFITNDIEISIEDDAFSVLNIDSFNLFVHKNLKLEHVSDNGNELVILGDVFNPLKPNDTNQIIAKVLVGLKSFDELLKATDKLTGRYVMFTKIRGSYHLLSDFFCQRQAYYWIDDQKLYVSSSDKLLLDCLGLELKMDEVKIKLSRSNYFLKIHEHWLLDEKDWDNRLKKLLPNHSLNISKKIAERIPIYSSRLIDKISFEEEALVTFKNSILAYSKRYSLILGLTSGYDSRLLMSSSITLNKLIKYFTINRKDTYVKRDVYVARRLAKRYKLNYETIQIENLSEAFRIEFEQQFLVPRVLDKTKNIQWFKNKNLQNTTIVSGNGGAIIRSIYKETDFENSNTICKALELEPNEYNLNAIDSWLSSARPFAKENGLLISDLFYLEVRLGKWGNKMVHEMDISGVEEFSPYNNRNLMYSILLNYNEEERKTITLNLLEQSLEGVTEIPFNPKTWKDTVKKIIFYEYYKKLIQKIK